MGLLANWRMSITRVIAASAGAAALGWIAAQAETLGLETVDDYGVATVAYATVKRSDGSYRRMLVTPDALPSLAAGGAPPDGTRILMETYYRPGEVSTVFHMQKVEARWHYGSFPSTRPNLAVRPQASCLACHARAAETDLVFTLPSLQAAAFSQGEAVFHCDRGGRSPCPPEVYQEGGAE